MWLAHELVANLADVDGQRVEVAGSVGYGDRAEWLFDSKPNRRGAPDRVRLLTESRVFWEYFCGPGKPLPATHDAKATVAGRVRRSSDPEFAAELHDLQWATLAHGPSSNRGFGVPFEERVSLLARHPRLDPGLSVGQLLSVADDWVGRHVRVWGYTVVPYTGLSPGDHDAATIDAAMVGHTSHYGDPSRTLTIERASLSAERDGGYQAATVSRSLRVDRAYVARCIVSGVLCRGESRRRAMVLRSTTDICFAFAMPPEELPSHYICFGADDHPRVAAKD